MTEIRQHTADPALFSLIPRMDALAFVRMHRILSHGLSFVLTDERSCLLVQGMPDEPVWVWTARGCSVETLHGLLLSLSQLDEMGRLPGIVSKSRFLSLAALAFENEPFMRQCLHVYRMDALRPFDAPGEYLSGRDVSAERAGELIAALAASAGEPISPSVRREMGLAFSKSTDTAAWRAPDGAIVSIAKRADTWDRYTDVHTVVTDEAYRNRGYAKAMLSRLCREILDDGRIPMLYADRDYAPSNAAYAAIGFQKVTQLYVLRRIGDNRKGEHANDR